MSKELETCIKAQDNTKIYVDEFCSDEVWITVRGRSFSANATMSIEATKDLIAGLIRIEIGRAHV